MRLPDTNPRAKLRSDSHPNLMSEEPCYLSYDEDLRVLLRLDREVCIEVISHMLGAPRMLPSDCLLTMLEVEEYVATGDIGAGRAMIQHARARRQAAM